jgi:hypothetical protein
LATAQQKARSALMRVSGPVRIRSGVLAFTPPNRTQPSPRYARGDGDARDGAAKSSLVLD